MLINIICLILLFSGEIMLGYGIFLIAPIYLFILYLIGIILLDIPAIKFIFKE